MNKRRSRPLLRRFTALACCGATLWGVAATTGATTAAEAVLAVSEKSNWGVTLMRWQLADYFTPEPLSLRSALVISQSPALLCAKDDILPRWEALQEEQEAEAPPLMPEDSEIEGTVLQPPEEPLPNLDFADNGVTPRTLVPSGEAGYTVVDRAYITNGTDHALDPAALAEPFDAALTGEAPQVLILHTHGSEAYTMPAGESYEATGEYRTSDMNYNVVRVGDEMAAVFAAAGISVLHDRTLYDSPAYSGAYGRSLEGIENYLAQYPSIRFVLDVHRDAISDEAGNAYKVVSQVPEGTAAQVSLIIGSDGSGLTHENWQENLKLAAAIQNRALAQYPTLMRPIVLRNSRYNQHVTTGSLLVEMGAAGNSLNEALLAARLFTQSMIEVIQQPAE